MKNSRVFVLLVEKKEAKAGLESFDGVEVLGVFQNYREANTAMWALGKTRPDWHVMLTSAEGLV